MRARLVVGVALVPLLLGLRPASAQSVVEVERRAEPIVLQGAQLPTWAGLPAEGTALPWPQGALVGERDAHAGTLVAPPATGVPVEEITAFRWDGQRFAEIPVQVDERFPYFLANPNSDFGIYSAVDEELTYAWDVESWKKTGGTCEIAYPVGESAMADPAVGLDTDDEVVFMASDAGDLAPLDAKGPVGTLPDRQQVSLIDPTSGVLSFVYLFRRPGGSSFDTSNGYVDYVRDANADQWIDRTFFAADDPEKLGTSNTGYGPNISGTVCDANGVPRASTDRFPRDGVTVSTDAYEWYASGRWMVRDMRIAKPGQPGVYGHDLVDRWKGRAFQSSPDSTISVVGFEDEQVNWEANSTLIGERTGPVRAIRETWGADSGTNTTKTEFFYRDVIAYHYHVRVHPIPPDGLYQAWDYNAGVAAKYYNILKPDGVDIDGRNDDMGNVDAVPVTGQAAFFDVNDPTFNLPLATLNWQQVSGVGDAGSLVYITEMDSATSAENPAVVPYYRDDACFDDGTGDDPVARPWPGENSQDQRVKDGYAENAGVPYDQMPCDQRQGAWGAHGVHYFFAGDTDNAFQPKPVTEIEATEWQFAVTTTAPASVGARYGAVVQAPTIAAAVPLLGAALVATNLEIEEPAGGQATDAATVAATLKDAGGNALADKPVRFELQGEAVDATTQANGRAEATFTVEGPAGETPLRASFAGDDDYAADSDEATFTVEREEPTLEIAEPATGQTTDVATLRATLHDGSAPVANKTVRFELQGVAQEATTDADGLAQVQQAISGPAGSVQLHAESVGDDTYAAASDDATFVVTREDVTLSFVASKRTKKNRTTITASLSDRDAPGGIAQAPLRLFVSGRQVQTLETGADGTVRTTIELPKKKRPTIELRFDGDDTYNSAVAKARHDPKRGASGTS